MLPIKSIETQLLVNLSVILSFIINLSENNATKEKYHGLKFIEIISSHFI
jgi:hypothetical protein